MTAPLRLPSGHEASDATDVSRGFASPWIQRSSANPTARTRLFVFPYAGAGASVYRTWRALLPKDVELCAVQLPGREARISEEAYEHLKPLVLALSKALTPAMDRPTAFFGHSFGAVVAFALADHLLRAGGPAPSLVMVSGRPAPRMPPRHALLHELSQEKFLETVSKRYQAIPEALLQEPEILELVLPALRADIALTERHQRESERSAPISIPLIAYGGRTDPLVHETELLPWGEMTNAEFEMETFEGGHFYLNDPAQRATLLMSIGRALSKMQ